MKYNFFSFAFFIITLNTIAQSPVIPGSAIFVPGENYTLKTDTTPEHLANLFVGDSGENVIWNFSEILTPNGDTVRYDFTTSQSQPFSAAFVGSNTAQTISNEGNINFFQADETGSKTIGSLIPSGTGSYFVFLYTNPLQNFILPLEYNDAYLDSFECYYPQFGMNFFLRKGTIQNQVDGYGTLLLPNGVVYDDVLRVRSEYFIVDITNNIPAQRDTISETFYAWYRADEKMFPILQIGEQIYNGFNSTQNIVTKYIRFKTGQNLLTLAANLKKEDETVLLFPNPSNTIINIKTSDQNPFQSAELFDASGRHIASINSGETLLDVSLFSKGFYNLRVIKNNKTENHKILIY